MTKARCDKLENCAWVAKAQKCRYRPPVTNAPSHVPTLSPTITPVVYPCSYFKHVVGCCGAKYASGKSTACVNAQVSPANSCHVRFMLCGRGLTLFCARCSGTSKRKSALLEPPRCKASAASAGGANVRNRDFSFFSIVALWHCATCGGRRRLWQLCVVRLPRDGHSAPWIHSPHG